MIRLVMLLGKGRTQVVELTKPATDVGRSAEMDLVLDNPSVSRHHARLLLARNELSVEDLGSQNGVRVNGEKLAANSERSLEHGDEIMMGTYDFVYVSSQERFFRGRFIEYMPVFQGTSSQDWADETYPMSVADVVEMERNRKLIRNAKVVSLKQPSKFWHPEDRPLTFGKKAMVLVGGMMTPAVAAEVKWEEGWHSLAKVGGLGKVSVNGTAIKEQRLKNGDRLQIGDAEFTYRKE